MAKILAVDDNIEMLETLERIFEFYNFECFTAENGKVAIEQAKKNQPDLIILDAFMPVMDGFEACKKLKTNPKTKHIPIVFLSAKYTTTENLTEGYNLGADDYILKPFNSKELVARIRAILKKIEEIKRLKKKNVELLKSSVKDAGKQLDVDPNIDTLTGLFTKDYFLQKISEDFDHAVRYEEPLTILLIEIDDFERIDEGAGQKFGEYILMKMTNVILNANEQISSAFRYDEDKFALILKNTNSQTGFFEAEKLRITLNQYEYLDESVLELQSIRSYEGYKNITVSIGIATHSEINPSKTAKLLLEKAKEALAKAKSTGRNKTYSLEKGS